MRSTPIIDKVTNEMNGHEFLQPYIYNLQVTSTTTTMGSELIDEPEFGGALVNELLEAFQACDIVVDRREFKECRTEMFSEAYMYSQYIHPTSLEVVEHVRSTMERLGGMEGVQDFIEDSKMHLEDCEIARGKVKNLVEQHAIVLGTLRKLNKKMEKEQGEMEESAAHILSSAEKHLHEANLLKKLRWATVFIPPVSGRIQEEAENRTSVAKKQKNDAGVLDAAAKSFDALILCHRILYKVIEVLANALNRMMTEMHSVSSAGKSVQSTSATAERGFNVLQKSATGVIRHCDTFIQTRVTYPETMVSIGAAILVTKDFETEWKERLKITE